MNWLEIIAAFAGWAIAVYLIIGIVRVGAQSDRLD